jgi:hypothetical protein
MELALVACLGWVVTTYLFVKHLGDLNHGHRLHVASLLNRIQAPEATVAQELVKDEDFDPIVLAHSEETYWDEVRQPVTN